MQLPLNPSVRKNAVKMRHSHRVRRAKYREFRISRLGDGGALHGIFMKPRCYFVASRFPNTNSMRARPVPVCSACPSKSVASLDFEFNNVTFAFETNFVALTKLASPAGFHRSIDRDFPCLNTYFGLSSRFDELVRLEELVQVDRGNFLCHLMIGRGRVGGIRVGVHRYCDFLCSPFCRRQSLITEHPPGVVFPYERYHKIPGRRLRRNSPRVGTCR